MVDDELLGIVLALLMVALTPVLIPPGDDGKPPGDDLAEL